MLWIKAEGCRISLLWNQILIEILAFFIALGSFLKIFSVRKGLALAKNCLSCIFIEISFNESLSPCKMQRILQRIYCFLKNITKVLLRGKKMLLKIGTILYWSLWRVLMTVLFFIKVLSCLYDLRLWHFFDFFY